MTEISDWGQAYEACIRVNMFYWFQTVPNLEAKDKFKVSKRIEYNLNLEKPTIPAGAPSNFASWVYG